MKILIVEDEQDLRETIRTSLLKEKFVVETAADYFSALDKINDYDYDCILLDIMLLYPDKRQAEVGGAPLQLNRKEFDLLYYFVVNANRVINKMSLAESVWGDNIDQADSLDFIYSQVKNLRKKLKQANASVELKAVYGFGYKLSEL